MEWSKRFTQSGREGVCPYSWSTDGDGSIFMVGRFEGELKLDAVRLETKDEASYLARLSSRGEPDWAVALPPDTTTQRAPDITQLKLFGDRVFLASGGTGAEARFVYTKTGKPVATRRLAEGEVNFTLLLDATSWVVNQLTAERKLVLRYQDERGNNWQQQYFSHHNAAPAGSLDGRIASVGDFDLKRAATESFDRVSVLANETGKVLFSTPLPSPAERTEELFRRGADTLVGKLAFDAKQRLWISGTTVTDFVLILGPRGEPIAELSVDEGAGITEGPVLLSDGRAVLALQAWKEITLRSSFAGSAKFGPGETLIELDIDRKRATLREAPARTGCLAPTSDGGLLGCVQHFVKSGTASWPDRCDLVKWKLPAPSSRGGS